MPLMFIVYRYAEYVLVKDVSNLIKVPNSLPLDVAAILPCGALAAYAAVQRVRPFVEDRLLNSSGLCLQYSLLQPQAVFAV